MAQDLGQWRWIGDGDELTGDECNASKVVKMVVRAW